MMKSTFFILFILSSAIYANSRAESKTLTIFYEEYHHALRALPRFGEIFLEDSIPSLTFELLESSDKKSFKDMTYKKLELENTQFGVNSIPIMEVVPIENSPYVAFPRRDFSYLEHCELETVSNALITCSTKSKHLGNRDAASISRIREDKGYLLVNLKQKDQHLLQVFETEHMSLVLSLDTDGDLLQRLYPNAYIISLKSPFIWLCYTDSKNLYFFSLDKPRNNVLEKVEAEKIFTARKLGFTSRIVGSTLVATKVVSYRPEWKDYVIALFDGNAVVYFELDYPLADASLSKAFRKRIQIELPNEYKNNKNLIATVFYENSLFLFSNTALLFCSFRIGTQSTCKFEDLTLTNAVINQVISSNDGNDIQVAGLLLERPKSFIFTLKVDEITKSGVEISRTLLFSENFKESTIYCIKNKASIKEILNQDTPSDLILLKTDNSLTVYEAPDRSYLQHLASMRDECDMNTQERRGRQRQYSLKGHTPLTFNSTNPIISSKGSYMEYSIDIFVQTIFEDVLFRRKSSKPDPQSDCNSDIAVNLNQLVSGTILNASFTPLNPNHVIESIELPFQVLREPDKPGKWVWRISQIFSSNGFTVAIDVNAQVFDIKNVLFDRGEGEMYHAWPKSIGTRRSSGTTILMEYFPKNETLLLVNQGDKYIFLHFWNLRDNSTLDTEGIKIYNTDPGTSVSYEPVGSVLTIARAGVKNILQFCKLNQTKLFYWYGFELKLDSSDCFYSLTTASVFPQLTQQPLYTKMSTNFKNYTTKEGSSKLELDLFIFVWDDHTYMEYSKCTVELDLVNGAASRIRNDCRGKTISKFLGTERRGINSVNFVYAQPQSESHVPSTPHVSIGYRNGNMFILELTPPHNSSEAILIAELRNPTAYQRIGRAYWNRTTRTLFSVTRSQVDPYDCALFAYVISEGVDLRAPDPSSVQKIPCPPYYLEGNKQLFFYNDETAQYGMFMLTGDGYNHVIPIKDSSSYLLKFAPILCIENAFKVVCNISVQNYGYNLTFEEIIYEKQVYTEL